MERLLLERVELERVLLELVPQSPTEPKRQDVDPSVALLITAAVTIAAVCIAITQSDIVATAHAEPLRFAGFLALTVGLQLLSADMYGRGGEGVSAIGMLASGFALGPGPAMAIAVVAALVQWVRRRGLLYKALFDAADFALAAGASAFFFARLAGPRPPLAAEMAAAVAAGIAYKAINTGLLCLAMSLSEHLSVRAVWRERFSWARFHYLAFGPLALASATAYAQLGVPGLLAFAVPPALIFISFRQYLERTRASVEEVREANEELRRANAELAARNDDLQELFGFGAGLAARAHDRERLVDWAEQTLERVLGAPARLSPEIEEGALALVAGGEPVGSLRVGRGDGFDRERWHRLRDALLPQLATALESAALVQQVRRTHLATIAALSRSIEVKDAYTGRHTERVSELSVALARRLGYSGLDLDAIAIGALLHDIGKIGIPERILHKTGPLDDDEWRLMKEHPLISEEILKEADLPPIVLEIARWSHERIDGAGYPDGLVAEEIPLPARIVLVADAFDALTSDRPYRGARSVHAALEELRRNSGTQFCARVIEALEQVWRDEPRLLGGGRLTAVA